MPHEKMKLHGNWFPATVVNNNDPDRAGKATVRIPGVDDGVEDYQLPWSLPMGGLGPSYSGLYIPPVGAGVFVFFPAEDTHYRYYQGANTLGATKDIADLIADYPNGYVNIDPMGVTTIANTSKKTYSVGFPDGSGFLWDNGDVTVYATKTLTLGAGNAVTISAPSVAVQGTNSLTLNGDSVTTNGNQVTIEAGAIGLHGPVTQTGSGSPSFLHLNIGTIPNAKPTYPPPFNKRDSSQTILPDATLTNPNEESGT